MIFSSVGALVLGLVVGHATGSSAKNTASASAATPQTVVSTVTVTESAAPAPSAASSAAADAASAEPKPSTTAAAAKKVVLSTRGTGIRNSKSFVVGPEWSLKYTFDCSKFGSEGNFIVDEDGGHGDILANTLAKSGGDTTYQHNDPGTHYLSVNSECDWTLTVTDGDQG